MVNVQSANYRPARNSGIDLLKIIGILSIILSHCTQTMERFFPFKNPSINPVFFVLQLFRHGGAFGNLIFVVSSSFFLLKSNKTKKHKAVGLLFDSQIISIGFLLVILALHFIFSFNINTSADFILTQLFPDLYNEVWFVPAYVIFYLIHPYLNGIINSISRREHFAICFSSIIIYIILGLFGSNPAYSDFIGFIIVYFIVGYLDKYCHNLFYDKKRNWLTFITSILLLIVVLFVKNLLGLNIPFFVIYPITNNNLVSFFLLPAVLNLFGIFLSFSFSNRRINYLSSLTLFIYCVHENRFAREILRPKFYEFLINRFGDYYVLLYVFALFIAVTIASVVFSIVYKATLHKISTKASLCFTSLISKKFEKFWKSKNE